MVRFEVWGRLAWRHPSLPSRGREEQWFGGTVVSCNHGNGFGGGC